MKITMLQTDIVPADPRKNTDAASALMDQAPGSDLYILPEMFSTGFCTSPEGIAEEERKLVGYLLGEIWTEGRKGAK